MSGPANWGQNPPHGGSPPVNNDSMAPNTNFTTPMMQQATGYGQVAPGVEGAGQPIVGTQQTANVLPAGVPPEMLQQFAMLLQNPGAMQQLLAMMQQTMGTQQPVAGQPNPTQPLATMQQQPVVQQPPIGVQQNPTQIQNPTMIQQPMPTQPTMQQPVAQQPPVGVQQQQPIGVQPQAAQQQQPVGVQQQPPAAQPQATGAPQQPISVQQQPPAAQPQATPVQQPLINAPGAGMGMQSATTPNPAPVAQQPLSQPTVPQSTPAAAQPTTNQSPTPPTQADSVQQAGSAGSNPRVAAVGRQTRGWSRSLRPNSLYNTRAVADDDAEEIDVSQLPALPTSAGSPQAATPYTRDRSSLAAGPPRPIAIDLSGLRQSQIIPTSTSSTPSSTTPSSPSPRSTASESATPPQPVYYKKEIVRVFFPDGSSKTLVFDANLTFDDLRAALKNKVPIDISQWEFFEVRNGGATSIHIPGTTQIGAILSKWPAQDRNNPNLNKFVIQPTDKDELMRASEVQQLMVQSNANQRSIFLRDKEKVCVGELRLPVFKGWLAKRGDDVIGSWKSRWFILQEGRMYYFPDQDERTKSKGYIDLRQCVLIKDQPKYAGSGHEFPFVLSHESGRDYILAATQFNERADWMRFIQPLVKAVHEQDPMSPRSRDTKRVTAKSESKPRASDAAKPSEKQAPVPLATKAEMKAVEKVMDSFESEGPKLQHLTAGRPKVGGRRPPTRPGRIGAGITTIDEPRDAAKPAYNDSLEPTSSGPSATSVLFGSSSPAPGTGQETSPPSSSSVTSVISNFRPTPAVKRPVPPGVAQPQPSTPDSANAPGAGGGAMADLDSPFDAFDSPEPTPEAAPVQTQPQPQPQQPQPRPQPPQPQPQPQPGYSPGIQASRPTPPSTAQQSDEIDVRRMGAPPRVQSGPVKFSAPPKQPSSAAGPRVTSQIVQGTPKVAGAGPVGPRAPSGKMPAMPPSADDGDVIDIRQLAFNSSPALGAAKKVGGAPAKFG